MLTNKLARTLFCSFISLPEKRVVQGSGNTWNARGAKKPKFPGAFPRNILSPGKFPGRQGCLQSTEGVKYLVHFWNSKPLLTGFQSSLSHDDTQLGAEGAR